MGGWKDPGDLHHNSPPALQRLLLRQRPGSPHPRSRSGLDTAEADLSALAWHRLASNEDYAKIRENYTILNVKALEGAFN